MKILNALRSLLNFANAYRAYKQAEAQQTPQLPGTTTQPVPVVDDAAEAVSEGLDIYNRVKKYTK